MVCLTGVICRTNTGFSEAAEQVDQFAEAAGKTAQLAEPATWIRQFAEAEAASSAGVRSLRSPMTRPMIAMTKTRASPTVSPGSA